MLYTQGKQFLYGDTSVLQASIMELIGGNKEDTHEQYGVRKHSIVDDGDLAGLRSRGMCRASIVTKMWFNPSFMIHSVKPPSPVPEETETVDKADKDLNSLLLEHGLADARSVSTYHTHTQTATETVEVRNNFIQ